MPIYEYKCEICSQIFEQLVFNSEEEEQITCPKCGDKYVKRVMSLTGLLGTSCITKTAGNFS